jgi:hypothetical protein
MSLNDPILYVLWYIVLLVGGFDASVAGSIGKFFTSCSYVIGGLKYSLDELEHGILRNNAIHPSSGLR